MSAPDRLSELLVRWENLHKQGQTVSAEELCADCPELVEELKQRIRALQSMDEMLQSEYSAGGSAPWPGPDAEAAINDGPAVPGYEILRLLDHGGMGEVFAAKDERFHREVALKRIQPGRVHDSEIRRRFLLEAELTGRLEHPGVAPVHALLEAKDGQPCYVMRFIQGETLHDAIQRFHEADQSGHKPGERSLALRQLLSRFITVCNTVAYAHSRGILHRDVKPSNIMLGKYAETLLIDWGLAKPIEGAEAIHAAGEEALSPACSSDEISRRDGHVVGTPAYMSPEQAAGRSDLVGAASDIYSLGATLYALLTGQAPLPGRQVLAQAPPGPFPPPGQVKKNVSRGLEAICLKAMAILPEDRYATALDLGADVEHWLADEPLTAWKEPLTTKARRWAKRHRVLVASAAVGLVVALVGITVGLVKVNAAWDSAEQHRQRAETALQLALDAADDFRHASEELLLDFPGLQPKRKQMLESALGYYQDLLRQRGVEPKLRAELAATYFRLAQVNADVGTPQETAQAFQSGLEIVENLIGKKVNLAAFASALGGIYKGRIRGLNNQPDMPIRSYPQDALLLLDHARGIWEQLVAQHPDVMGFQNDLAGLHNAIGVLQNAEGQPAAALDSYQSARQIWGDLVQRDPTNANFRSDLAITYGNAAESYRVLNQPEKALDQLQKGLQLQHQLVLKYPDKPGFRNDLAGSYVASGLLQESLKQQNEAQASFRQALEAYETLARTYPLVPDYQKELATVREHLRRKDAGP